MTGLGCLSPLGVDVQATWDAAIAGRSGIVAIDLFDPSELPVRIAGQVPGEIDLGDVPVKEARRLDRSVKLALAAANQAFADSKLVVDDENRDRMGVAIGSGIGGLTTITAGYRALQKGGARKVSPFTIPMGISNMAAGYVSIQLGMRGPNLCHVSACSTGAHSIGEAARTIARGDADVMIAGGTEAPVCDLGVAGFAAMRALSERNDEPEKASRPFDSGRDGFVMGEGAAVLVLESLERAQARGAEIYAELSGYAATADAQHIAAPDESGEGAARCMALALADAGVEPGEVGYVNAHATSTPAGDPAEVKALESVFGSSLDAIPVSSTKSMTGHLLGAAGALEALFCVRAIESGTLPPTINLDDPDPACRVHHVTEARKADARLAISNSFGFGGTNACLAFARID